LVLLDHEVSCVDSNCGDNGGRNGMREDSLKEEREDDYVYDLYCLEEATTDDDNDDNDEKKKGGQVEKNREEAMDACSNDDFVGDNATMNGDTAPTPASFASTAVSASTTTTSCGVFESTSSSGGVEPLQQEQRMDRSRTNSADNNFYGANNATPTSNNERDVVLPPSNAQKKPQDQPSSSTHADEYKQSPRPTVEFSGGVGYWNEEGELVLEAESTLLHGDEDSDMDNDDDEDSNDEAYGGNDYPDEDCEDSDNIALYEHGYNDRFDMMNQDDDDPFMAGATASRHIYGQFMNSDNNSDSDEDSMDMMMKNEFRNRPITHFAPDDGRPPLHAFYGDYHDDDDDHHDEIDVDGDNYHGGFSNQSERWSNERIYGAESEYAYDPDHYDEEDD